ncbi:MAG: AMP-binding protein [Myxococcota bacterium]
MIRGRDWLPSDWLARHRGIFLDGPDGTLDFGEVRRRVLERARTLPSTIRPEATASGVVEALAALERGRRTLLVHPKAPGRAPAEPSDPGPGDEILFTTSGSTGRPKRVRLSRTALDAAAKAHAARLPWKDGDRWLLSIPPAHIGGFSIIVRCLQVGATIVLPDALRTGFRAEAFRADAKRGRFSLASMVPTMLHRLAPEDWPNDLRIVLLGGASARPELLQRFADRPVLGTYGLTEACAQVATEALEQERVHPRGLGRPLPGVELRIVSGRVQIRGPTLMRGYLGRESFESGGWFDTGDLGGLDEEGQLFVRGRSDDLIVTGGENVHPTEVEAALAGLEGVDALCVFGLPDPEWGQCVGAVFVGDVSPERVEADARMRLPDFRRPTRWCRVDALPTGPTGKTERRAARALFERGRLDAPKDRS